MRLFSSKFLLTSVFIAAIFCGHLHAQGNGVSIRFRAAAWTEGEPAGFSYLHKGKLQRVENLQSSVRSEMLDYSGPATLSLYPLDAPADTPPEPLATVKLPPGIKTPLLILAPNPDPQGTPYRALVVEDNPASFPFPSYNFISLCKTPVAIALNKQNFTLQPGKRQLATSEDKTLNLRIAVPRKKTDGWRVVSDNFYPNWPQERTLVFLLDVTKNGSTRIEPRILLENKSVWERGLRRDKDAEP